MSRATKDIDKWPGFDPQAWPEASGQKCRGFCRRRRARNERYDTEIIHSRGARSIGIVDGGIAGDPGVEEIHQS